MVGYRVTKYNPQFRLPNGAYSRNEWTSASDIGRDYDGRVVSLTDYIRVENSYVAAVRFFLDAARLQTLIVKDLQINEFDGSERPSAIASEVAAHQGIVVDGMAVSGDGLDWVVRLALREAIWCRLEGDSNFYVHFGYDYYMYIGMNNRVRVPVVPEGIFVEVFESPYHAETA